MSKDASDSVNDASANECLGEAVDSKGPPSTGRRFLIKAGLAAAPVFFTLRGLPARAGSPGMGSLGDYDYGSEPGDGGEGWEDSQDWNSEDRNRESGDQFQKNTGSSGRDPRDSGGPTGF